MDLLILLSEGLVGAAFGYAWGGRAHTRLAADRRVRRLAFLAVLLVLWFLQLAILILFALAFRPAADPNYLLWGSAVGAAMLAWGLQLGYAAASPATTFRGYSADDSEPASLIPQPA